MVKRSCRSSWKKKRSPFREASPIRPYPKIEALVTQFVFGQLRLRIYRDTYGDAANARWTLCNLSLANSKFARKFRGFCLLYDELCAICSFSSSISSRRFSDLPGPEVYALSSQNPLWPNINC